MARTPPCSGGLRTPFRAQGRLVEFVRLIFVTLFAAAGYTVATRVATSPSQTLAYVVLGTSTGFVLGGVLGRQTATAVRSMEEELHKVPAAEIVAGVGGLVAGLAVAALLSVPVFRLPPLAAWTSAATVEVHLVEEDGGSDVDALLVRMARERGASLVTTDHNLSKVAEAVGVPVPRLNDLAAEFRLPVGIGDEIDVHLVKPGRESGQAVGYLDDGTMVVVEAAGERIGSDTPIVVRNVIKTATGRMVFANLQ